MRVAEHGHAVGRERQHLVHGALESLGGLMGQSVDQVHVDAGKAQVARRLDQIARHLEGLNAVDGLLHFGIEVLNAQAQAIEAQALQAFQMLLGGDARVDFDADFGIGSERKALGGVTEQVFHLRGREIGGRSAAPVKLRHAALTRNVFGDVLDFFLERCQIGRRDAVILGDDHVAGAEQAQALAEGQVHVERDGRLGGVGLGEELIEVVRSDVVLPDGRGRVAGVARPGTVVAGEELLGDAKPVAIEVQAEFELSQVAHLRSSADIRIDLVGNPIVFGKKGKRVFTENKDTALGTMKPQTKKKKEVKGKKKKGKGSAQNAARDEPGKIKDEL